MKKLNIKSFLLLTIGIFLINIIVSLFNDLQLLRTARLATTLFYVFYFLSLKLYKNIVFTFVFVLIFLSDLGLYYYENEWFCYLRFVSFIVMHILLSCHIYNKSYFKTLKPLVLFTFLIFFLSIVFLIPNLKSILDLNTFGKIQEYLYYIYSLTITILILLTVIYNLNNTSKRVEVFFGMVVSFFVSDILLMVGYYQNFFLVIQIERFFKVLTMFMLVYYVVLLRNNEHLNSEKLI